MKSRAASYLAVGTVAAAALAVTFSGCAGLGQPLQEPEVRLAGVEIAELGMTKQRFVLEFDVSNPNAVRIPVRAIDYRVHIAGEEFATGKNTEAFTLPANGDGSFSLEVDTNLLRTADMLYLLVMKGGERELEYEVAGSFRINLPFAKALPFRQSGVVTLDR